MKKPWLEGIEVIDVNKPATPWSGWLETLGLTAVVILVSFLTQQQDPFRLGEGFPWPVLAPLLAGLRYGFPYGFVSALLILATLGAAINQQWQMSDGFPLQWAIGVVVVAMVAGEFRDMWGRRLHRLEGAYEYRAERLEEFTRSYQLLRLSHDRLEQTVANSGFSLREGITRLQAALEPTGVKTTGLSKSAYQQLLEFVADYGAVTQACIMELSADRLDTASILATIGESFPVDDGDPVLRTALETGELAAVNLVKEYATDVNQLLAAVPLADSTGEIHGILLVRSMPFFAFHEDNLKLIGVLAAHGMDHLRFGTAASSTARFVAGFKRVHQDFMRFKLYATLLRLPAGSGDASRIYEELRLAVRAIDVICMGRDEDGPAIWILLPLTDLDNARAWVKRTNGISGGLHGELISIGDIDPRRIRSLEPY